MYYNLTLPFLLILFWIGTTHKFFVTINLFFFQKKSKIYKNFEDCKVKRTCPFSKLGFYSSKSHQDFIKVSILYIKNNKEFVKIKVLLIPQQYWTIRLLFSSSRQINLQERQGVKLLSP